jgi:hypothetical protein
MCVSTWKHELDEPPAGVVVVAVVELDNVVVVVPETSATATPVPAVLKAMRGVPCHSVWRRGDCW